MARWRAFFLIFSLVVFGPELSRAQTGLLQPGQVLGNNGSSSAVISSVDTNALSAQTSNYSVASTDCGKTILAGTGSTGQFTLTLPSSAGFPSSCSVLIKNGDTGSNKVLSGFPSDLGSVLYPLQSFGVKIVNGGWQSFYSPAPLAQPGAILGVDAKSQSLSEPASPQPIIPWSPQIHQDGGGVNFGHTLMWADQNTSLQADLFSITSGDQSILQSFTIGGTPVAGNTLTITFTLATIAYPVVYTVQAGDTTATIATAMAACAAGGSTHCTGGATFVAALLAFHGADGIGYRPAAGARGSSFVMDFPWAASGNSIAVSATGGGATISGGTGTNLDNGPIITTGRNVPGRTPVAGDQPFNFQMGCQSGPNTSIDTTCGSIPLIYLGTASAAHVYSTLAFGAAANSNQGPIAWYVGPMGVYTADALGDGNGCGGFTVDAYSANDPGFGNLGVCGQIFVGVSNFGGNVNPTTQSIAEISGTMRVDSAAHRPTSGAGLELSYNGTATLLSYDETGNTYQPLQVLASTINLFPSDSATSEVIDDAAGLYPNTDNAITLGKSTKRWSSFFAAAATIGGISYPAGATSGGIPYFSSTSAMASSAQLSTNGIVVGGGAGNAPNTGTGCTLTTLQIFSCQSSMSQTPQLSFENDTSDSTSVQFNTVKSRSGGTVSSGDSLFNFFGIAYANSGNRVAAQFGAAVAAGPSGANVPTKWQFIASNASGLLNQTLTFDNNGHLSTVVSAAPTAGACGTSPSIGSGSTDNAGSITAGTGTPTSCTINFGVTWAAAPKCVLASQTQLAAFSYTVSASAITVTQTATSSNVITWQCGGGNAFLLGRDVGPANDNAPLGLPAAA